SGPRPSAPPPPRVDNPLPPPPVQQTTVTPPPPPPPTQTTPAIPPPPKQIEVNIPPPPPPQQQPAKTEIALADDPTIKSLTKKLNGSMAEGDLDIANAKAMDPNIVKEFADYGVQ